MGYGLGGADAGQGQFSAHNVRGVSLRGNRDPACASRVGDVSVVCAAHLRGAGRPRWVSMRGVHAGHPRWVSMLGPRGALLLGPGQATVLPTPPHRPRPQQLHPRGAGVQQERRGRGTPAPGNATSHMWASTWTAAPDPPAGGSGDLLRTVRASLSTPSGGTCFQLFTGVNIPDPHDHLLSSFHRPGSWSTERLSGPPGDARPLVFRSLHSSHCPSLWRVKGEAQTGKLHVETRNKFCLSLDVDLFSKEIRACCG